MIELIARRVGAASLLIAFAFAQFFDDTEIRGNALALGIAGMSVNLADAATSESPKVLLSVTQQNRSAGRRPEAPRQDVS